MSTNLRASLIKLAHQNPNLRAHLLPILTARLDKQAMKFDTKEEMEKYKSTHDVRSDTEMSVRSHDEVGTHHRQEGNKHWDAISEARRKNPNSGKEDDGSDVFKHRLQLGGHARAEHAHAIAATSPSAKNTAQAHALTSVAKNHKKWHADVHQTMLKHNLLDTDADQLKTFKGNKPSKGTPISDQVLMQRFLAKAKPETKERMKGMSVADFKLMYAAINSDEE